MFKSIMLTALMAGWCMTCALGQDRYPHPVGQVHPNFELPDIESGDFRSLSDLRGQKVLLVHFASW